VFRKYGLLDKAADQFEAVSVARFPTTWRRARSCATSTRRRARAPGPRSSATRSPRSTACAGDEAAAGAAEQEARELAPAAAPRPAPPPAFARTVHLEEEEIQLEDAGDELSLDAADEEEIPLDVEPSAAEEPVLMVEEEHSFDLDEPATSGGGDLSGQFLDEDTRDLVRVDGARGAGAVAARGRRPCWRSTRPLLSLEQDVSSTSRWRFEPEPPPPPPPVAATRTGSEGARRPAPPPPARPAGLPPEVERVLEEVDQ
jgi:hypothetical protein